MKHIQDSEIYSELRCEEFPFHHFFFNFWHVQAKKAELNLNLKYPRLVRKSTAEKK